MKRKIQMKKFLSLIALSVFLFVSLVYAGGQIPPPDTYARCIWNVDQEAKAAGLKKPWTNGNINALNVITWDGYTLPKYNLCSCKYLGRPINKLFDCWMVSISSISGDDTKP